MVAQRLPFIDRQKTLFPVVRMLLKCLHSFYDGSPYWYLVKYPCMTDTSDVYYIHQLFMYVEGNVAAQHLKYNLLYFRWIHQ